MESRSIFEFEGRKVQRFSFHLRKEESSEDDANKGEERQTKTFQPK